MTCIEMDAKVMYMNPGDLVKSPHDKNLLCGYGIVIEHKYRHLVKVLWINDAAIVDMQHSNVKVVYEVP